MALFCPQCGAATTPGSAYCGTCGSSLQAPPPQPMPAPLAGASPIPYVAAPVPAARPQGVTAIAVACFVVAGFAILGALAVAFVGAFLGAAFSDVTNGISAQLAGTFILVALLFLGAFAAALIVVGYGLNKGRGWARIGAIVLAVLFGLGQFGDAVSGLAGLGSGRGGGILVPLLFVAGAAYAVYYLMKPDVRAWFDAQPR